jgi:hypothetical protein
LLEYDGVDMALASVRVDGQFEQFAVFVNDKNLAFELEFDRSDENDFFEFESLRFSTRVRSANN